MKLFDVYLIRAIFAATALVLAVLLAVAAFSEFVGQLDDIGTGEYGTLDATLFTALRLPILAVQMLPMALLIGALLGLGALAGHSELTVMRGAGVSPWRMAGAAAGAGLVMMLASLALGEYLAPPLDQFARKYKNAAKNVETGLTGERGTWVKEGSTIFNVERISRDFDFGGVYIFELDGGRRLVSIGHADDARLDAVDRWVLDNYGETRFDEEGARASRRMRSVQDHNVDAELLGVTIVKPSSLSLRGLADYIAYLKRNDLDAAAYRIELWSRIASTVTIVIMPVLAIGFVFGSLRSAGAGARLLVGVLIGLAYFFASRMLGTSGQVFNLNPVVIAWLPSLALAAVTAFAVSRVR